MLVKNHHKGPFKPTYIYNDRVANILNESPVLLTTPGGKEKKCNIHHVKPVSSLDVSISLSPQAENPTGTFPQFQDSIQQDSSSESHVNNNLKHS